MIRQKEKPYQLFAVLGFVTAAICFYFLCDLGILKSNKKKASQNHKCLCNCGFVYHFAFIEKC